MDLLTPGGRVRLCRPDGAVVSAVCDEVRQRAWSRTATAHEQDGSRLFLKQFVTRGGAERGEVMEGERAGALAAAELFADLDVSVPTASAPDQLVLAYPWRKMTPLDELLRSDGAAFASCLDSVLTRCARDVDRCREAMVSAPLSEKRVDQAQLGVGVVFKAFELRNVAVEQGSPRPVAFDLGRPRRGPVEEAGARLFVSAALLNWGRPLNRFASGPDESVLATAWARLSAVTTKAACLAELDHQVRTRMGDDSLTYGRGGRLARRLTLRVLGGRYRQRVSAWLAAR